MKIMFICGSLEPGCDGVGDYTRRLAGELTKQGHEVSLIALYDFYLTDEIIEFQNSDGIGVKVFRIPKLLNPGKRFKKVEKWINDCNPDWISLQFVPFSFHSKGLSFYLGKYLKKIGKDRCWHIMFHELWIGMHHGAPKKELAWGFLQRLAIKSIINDLKPDLIHTQSGLYMEELKQLGFDSMLLPLFSNIPVIKNDTAFTSNDKLIFVLFGGVHDTGAPVNQFAEEVKSFSIKIDKPVSLIIIGRGGKEQIKWERIWKANGMEVEILGEKSPEEISINLQNATFGITTTVFDKVEKSGSVAAMIEHGLNVICVAGPWKSRSEFQLEGMHRVFNYKQGELDTILSMKKAEQYPGLLEEVSATMIKSFISKDIN